MPSDAERAAAQAHRQVSLRPTAARGQSQAETRDGGLQDVSLRNFTSEMAGTGVRSIHFTLSGGFWVLIAGSDTASLGRCFK